MTYLKKPFFLGKLKLPSNIFCAPLAGCSDYPFRQMTGKYRPGLFFCEMVKMEALIRHDPHTFRMLDYDRSMHPIGAQICGANPRIAAQCARLIEELGFDSLDLNCGCPVDKVTKDGSGSALLRDPQKIGEILANMVAAVDIPVTLKVRTGWSDDEINAPEIVKIAEDAGAVAIAVHGRTREQGYRGEANWDHIAKCKQAAKTIKVIGNGDITMPEHAEKMFEQTGCDAILLARGTMGSPWLIEDVVSYLEKGQIPERGERDYQEVLLEHARLVQKYQPEKKAPLEMRKIACWYLKHASGAKALRLAINKATSIQEMIDLVKMESLV